MDRLAIVVIFLIFTTIASANLPFRKIDWPADDRGHFTHSRVVTEWWYYGGKLTAEAGEETKHFAYHLTVHYVRDQMGIVPMLDVQIIDLDEHQIYRNSIQLNCGQISSKTLHVFSNELNLRGDLCQYLIQLEIPTEDGPIGLNLRLTPLKRPLLIGADPSQRGLVDMDNETNSFYYSITRLQVQGMLAIGDGLWKINPDIGKSRSWMDHQWGDFSWEQVLKSNPWIWMGIQLEDGTDISVGELISTQNGQPIRSPVASISLSDGKSEYMPAKITPSSNLGSGYPLSYTVQMGNRSYRLRSVLSNQDGWMEIMSVNGRDILEPNAPFAIIENTVPPKKTVVLHDQ